MDITGKTLGLFKRGFSPPSVIFCLFAFFTGLFFVFFRGDPGVTNSILFKATDIGGFEILGYHVLIGLFSWWVLIGSTMCIYGVLKPSRLVIKIGSAACFMCYVWASTIYITAGAWLPFFTVAIVNMTGYAYFFLAASFTDRFPRSPVDQPCPPVVD